MNTHLLKPLALVLGVSAGSALLVAGYLESLRESPLPPAALSAPCWPGSSGLAPGAAGEGSGLDTPDPWVPPCARLDPAAEPPSDAAQDPPRRRT